MVADQPAYRPDHLPVMATLRVHGAGDLVRARRLLADTAAMAGLDSDRIEQFAVALSEVATNAILHGDGTATVMITSDEATVTVEVQDHGSGLQILPQHTPPHPTQIDGRGLWLVRQLCDQVDISSSPNGTTVRLTMRLRPTNLGTP
jgi:anti-sigma regulatory factor (Ser/Thr protein kinase)